MKYRKCEICGLKTERKEGKKRYFMARFPLAEARCRQWVKFTGNEDLVYVPIEKLNSNKFVCGKHFKDKDFKKKKTQLKKSAIPTIRLTAVPLSDEILTEFPCHLHVDNLGSREERIIENDALADHSSYAKRLHNDYNYSRTRYFQDMPRKAQPDTIITKYEHKSGFHESDQKTTKTLDAGREVDDECDDLGFDDFSPKRTNPLVPSENNNAFVSDDDSVVDSCNIEILNPITDENELFNNFSSKIQKDDDVMLVGEEDEDVYSLLNTKSEIHEDSGGDGDDDHFIPREHHGFRCNVCLGKIVGFRYRCCECEDYDMCSDCESRQQHPQHYVLRVPGCRKQAEVRGVMAALRLVLAPPNDVKDELTIKIEDQEEEHLITVPLDTSDADPSESADTEPMETDHSASSDPSVPLDSIACDNTPPSAEKPRIMPNKDNTPYKVVGIHTRQIPAIVRLDNLVMPFQENAKEPDCMESLRHVKQTSEQPTKKLTNGRYLPIHPKPFQAQKKHKAACCQNIAGNPENITVVKSVDKVTDLNAANVQYMMVEDFNTLMAHNVDNTVMCNDASSQEEVYHMTIEDFNTLMARRDNIVQCDYESLQGHKHNMPVEDFSVLIAQNDNTLVCNDEFPVYPSVRSKSGSWCMELGKNILK